MMLFINVYMPRDNADNLDDLFAKVYSVIENYLYQHSCAIGDNQYQFHSFF